MKRLKRQIIKAVRVYRTVSYNAAVTLGNMLPFHSAAKVNREIVYKIRSLERKRIVISRSTCSHQRQQVLLSVFKRRKEKLKEEHINQYLTVSAILPHWDNWIKRGSSILSFRTTQVLTRHGYFRKYLHRI